MKRAITPLVAVMIGIGVLLVGCVPAADVPDPTPIPPTATIEQAPSEDAEAAQTEELAEPGATEATEPTGAVETAGRDLPPEILVALPAAPAPAEAFRYDDPVLVGNTNRVQFVEFFTPW